MVPNKQLVVRPTDALITIYVTFTTIMVVVLLDSSQPEFWMLLGTHGLIFTLLFLFSRIGPKNRLGGILHILYPLVLLTPLYTELGILAASTGIEKAFAHDAIIQRWEAAVFGGQVSYEWIRNAPSVFWSGVLHLAYLGYYPIILAGPVLLLIRRSPTRASNVIFSTILAFVICYVVFALFPVAGPNYAFEHPTGAVREVWSARLVYGLLGTGSSFGTAFPSSHVAATVAANVALWREWRTLALIVLVPTILLVVGTVYCQMHYGIDAVCGLAVGVFAGGIGWWLVRRNEIRQSSRS